MRLEWFVDFATHRSISRTCRTFGIARTTFYRWLKRFDPENLDSLIDQEPPAAANRAAFVVPHDIGEVGAALPAPVAASTPDSAPEVQTPAIVPTLSRGWAGLALGVLASGFLVNLLLLAVLLAPVRTATFRAAIVGEESQEIEQPVALPENVAGSGAGVLATDAAGAPLSIDINDCTPSRTDGGWTCSLRIRP